VATDCLVYRGPDNGHGYGRVSFGPPRVDARGRRRGRQLVQLHRWVVEQVEGPLSPGEVVMHTCDNPPCFRYDHLVRATQLVNVRDAERKGRGRRLLGEAHPNAKLTAADVADIRASSDSQRELAARHGVSRTLIRKVRAGTVWRR